MCHFLPVHHLGIAFLAGSKVKILHIEFGCLIQIWSASRICNFCWLFCYSNIVFSVRLPKLGFWRGVFFFRYCAIPYLLNGFKCYYVIWIILFDNNHLFAGSIGLVGRVFANDPGDLGLIPGRVIPKTLTMVLDTSKLNTLQYKVRIGGNVEQSRERSSALPYLSVL